MTDDRDLARISVTATDGGATVVVSGEVDLANAAAIRDGVVNALQAPATAVDLTAVSYLDSSGIRMLLDVVHTGRDRATSIELVVAADSMVHRVLTISQFDRVCTVRVAGRD